MVVGASAGSGQVNRAAAVCVAFEEESVPVPGPLGNILLEHHTELVWRIGVEPIHMNDKQRLEESLISRLDGRVYVIDGGSCVWSDPELDQTHLVVIAYEGVVRQDLAVDPGDPRFQAFAIGYGNSWQEAEAEAVARARFNGYFDGLRYDMVVRETWDSTSPVTSARDGYAVWEMSTVELAESNARSMEPGTTFRDCEVCPELVVVPAGSFMMGFDRDERARAQPIRRVTIPVALAVGVYEVTFAEWDACVEAGGCGGYRPEDEWGRGRRPVGNVSWEEAVAFVAWLSEATGEHYRLPSEAEWEYFARAGAPGDKPWGDWAEACKHANIDDDGNTPPCRDGYDRETAPVGSFLPNAFGIYDTVGNVSEWTEDCWHDGYAGAPTDGSAWVTDCFDKSRVTRGRGAWSFIGYARFYTRQRMWPSVQDEPHPVHNSARSVVVGFRVVRDIVAVTDFDPYPYLTPREGP